MAKGDPILAKGFAYATADEQAHMFNSFARELFVLCGGRGGGLQGYETQCYEIAKKLDKDGITLIKDLHAFIELRKKDMED